MDVLCDLGPRGFLVDGGGGWLGFLLDGRDRGHGGYRCWYQDSRGRKRLCSRHIPADGGFRFIPGAGLRIRTDRGGHGSVRPVIRGRGRSPTGFRWFLLVLLDAVGGGGSGVLAAAVVVVVVVGGAHRSSRRRSSIG